MTEGYVNLGKCIVKKDILHTKEIQDLIKNNGAIHGAKEYFFEFLKKHPTYKTMDEEHNKYFLSVDKLKE
jgi:hypothetical protein